MVIGGQRWSLMVTDGHCGSLRVIEGQRWSLRFTEGHLTYLFVKGCAAAEDWSRAAQRLERTPVVVKSSHPPTTNPTHADHSYNVGSPIILSNFFLPLSTFAFFGRFCCNFSRKARFDVEALTQVGLIGAGSENWREQCGAKAVAHLLPLVYTVATGGLDHFIRCCVILPGRWFGAGVLVCQKRTCFPPNSLRQNLSH